MSTFLRILFNSDIGFFKKLEARLLTSPLVFERVLQRMGVEAGLVLT